jgi:hypothetical protein
MRLILSRSQKSTITGKPKFVLQAIADLGDEEVANVKKYRMGDTMLYTNLVDRGKGIIGAISRAIQGLEIRVSDLVSGKIIECKDILEMISIEDEIKEACKYFKIMLDTAARFGGDEVIEF